MIYFIADTHFWHRNIIEYEKRPFQSAEEMNEAMIRNWNAVVKAGDTVVHGGDFALCKKMEAKIIAEQLNGRKFLVLGNHDKSIGWAKDIGFDDAGRYWFEDGILVIHRPQQIDTNYKEIYEKCDVLLYAHTHSKVLPIQKGFNISVETIGYVPRTLAGFKRNGANR